MFDIGFSEVLMFGAMALLVLGSEKLPIAVRSAGRWYARIRFTIANIQRDIEQEIDIVETRRAMQQELAKIREAEQKMQQELEEIRGNMKQMAEEQNQDVDSIKQPAQNNVNTTNANDLEKVV